MVSWVNYVCTSYRNKIQITLYYYEIFMGRMLYILKYIDMYGWWCKNYSYVCYLVNLSWVHKYKSNKNSTARKHIHVDIYVRSDEFGSNFWLAECVYCLHTVYICLCMYNGRVYLQFCSNIRSTYVSTLHLIRLVSLFSFLDPAGHS